MPKKQPLLITIGDPRGIGPEICFKSLKCFFNKKKTMPPFVFIGSLNAILKFKVPFIIYNEIELIQNPQKFYKKFNAHKKQLHFPLIAVPEKPPIKVKSIPGFQSGVAIETATNLIKNSFSKALITGPIHKESLIQGGYSFSGHTDFLAHLSNTKKVTMMLSNSRLRVSLVTSHIPLKKVSNSITKEKIITTIIQTIFYLKNYLKISKPQIYVCALNPHAGEGGVLGDEEIKVIIPAIKLAQNKTNNCASILGPFASDSIFSKNNNKKGKNRADAFICMYHDQGLIPLKLFDFNNSINITLGLPFIRTSVDHGVAFDIAGKNIANPNSMIAAISLAQRLIKS